MVQDKKRARDIRRMSPSGGHPLSHISPSSPPSSLVDSLAPLRALEPNLQLLSQPSQPGYVLATQDSFQDRTMSAFRNHRIIIASLFLPVTIETQSPDAAPVVAGPPPTTILRDPAVDVAHKRTPSKPTSIVDDLTVKSRMHSPGVITPQAESINPFAALKGLKPATSTPPIPITLTSEPTEYASPESSSSPSPEPTPGSVLTPSNTVSPKPGASPTFLSSTLHRRRSTTPVSSSRHVGNSASRRRSQSRARTSANSPKFIDTTSFDWTVEPNPHGNPGLYNAVRSVESKLNSLLWIGVLSQHTDAFTSTFKREVERTLLDQHDCCAVWVPDQDFIQYYDVFCHQVLWPCLHYAVPDAPKSKTFYESKSFAQYKAVNQLFADAIVRNYEEGDIIWINDYHLFLVPSLVRQKIPTAIIGFFLHVAFPSSEIFRCLAVRQDLLKGILGADLVGFQTANFARHFRQTVSRIMLHETLPKGVQLEETFVDVAVFPMGIDVKTLMLKRKDPEVAEWIRLLKQRYAGLSLLVARDKLDDIQGVKEKLQAFETFLKKYPEFQGKAVLIQIALSTSDENEALASNVYDIVSRINSAFSTLTYQPIVFLHMQDLTFNQYLGLITVADVFMVTSLREGMALRAHEYVECQEGRARPLILSEFTGSYSFSGFRSCIPVNPWDARMTAEAIHQALTMSDAEAFSRWKDLHSHVNTQTAQAFVTSFLNRCVRVHYEHQQRDPAFIDRFPFDLVSPRYRYSQTRVLLLDYEDTLWIRKPGARDATHEPPTDALEVLKQLTADPKNSVWILSGLPTKNCLDKIAAAVPNLGICAENGCFIKPRKSNRWINMVANANLSWKAPVLEILNYFVERTPGSFIEERELSIVYRYHPVASDRGADLGWAKRQAAEAQNHIYDSLGERYALRVIPGATSFLVIPSNISRSSAVGAILQPGGPQASSQYNYNNYSDGNESVVDAVHNGGEIDFVMAIGGDQKLLRRLNELDNAETVTTSNKGSDAKWRLAKEDVLGTLTAFAKLA